MVASYEATLSADRSAERMSDDDSSPIDQFISNIFPFHDRAAKSISPSLVILRPSEI
jgi:hypothetical protein